MSGLIQYWSGTEVEMYLENEDEFKYLGKEHCISVLNHKFDADWLVGMVAVQNLGLLGVCQHRVLHASLFGSILSGFKGSKALFKESVKYVPIMGWLWYLAEHIFLKRNWEADSRRISMHFRSIFDYPKDHFINVCTYRRQIGSSI
jgi:lysophosphatidic acid acyltransferase/lysophosphatidylinositol acyltransferase